MKGPPSIPLPKGYRIGDRIKTNNTYALITPRRPGPRYGTIVRGSRSADGPVIVLLDGFKYAKGLTTNLFDVVMENAQPS